MLDSIFIALASSIGTGLMTWGGIRIELRWMRADIERLEKRLDRVERASATR